MKKNKKQLKSVALLLSILILAQGCTVYKTTFASLEEAAKAEVKAKVETNNGIHIKFKYIGYENGSYFGIKKSKGETIKMKLNERHINNLKLKDKTWSTILTVAVPITIIAAAVLIFQDSFKWKSGNLFEDTDFHF